VAERRRAYDVEIASEAMAQLRWLRRHAATDARRVEDAIHERLTYEPTREDRNRKTTTEGAPAPWELRVQPYRVFYEVDEAHRRVTIVWFVRKPREASTPLPTT